MASMEHLIGRKEFESFVEKHKRLAEEIKEEMDMGIIRPNNWLFTLDEVKAIAFRVYQGAWANCRKQGNPKSDWNRKMGRQSAKQIIDDAWT